MDQLLLAFVATILLLTFTSPILDLGHWWVRCAAQWSDLLRYAVVFLGAASGVFCLVRLGAAHPRYSLYRILRYPPVWVTALAVGGAFASDKGLISAWYRSYPWGLFSTFGAAVGGAILGLTYDELNGFIMHCSRLRPRDDSRAADEGKILKWVLDERPILAPADDVFDHKMPAQRIAALLRRKATASVGIIGPYGSGKTSLINLIQHYLAHPRELPEKHRGTPLDARIVVCRVGGWGRVSGTVAQKIIALSIEEVKRHVDCLSIVTLPENYRQAIGGVKSPVGTVLAALLHVSHDPVVQLGELDEILLAAGLRLVIVLEDLDRNVGDEILRDEMPALLDRLRMLRQVSFVLAIGTDRQFSDVLIRICDHVETIA